MKLVILGAGASFDSVYEFFDEKSIMPWRPPLANELFDARLEFRNIFNEYFGAKFYLSELNVINDIEDFFQKEWDFLNNNRTEHLMAAFLNLNYCLADLMSQISKNYENVGLSNYDILIKKAHQYAIQKKEDVIFVSFNYDVLLEKSVGKLYFGEKRKFDISDYLEYPVKIIKPHGSCNWVKRFGKKFTVTDVGSVSNHLYRNKINLREINANLEGDIFCVDNPSNGRYHDLSNKEWNCFPQLLVPLKDKDDFILPKAHIEYLENNIEKITEILVVGWKGSEVKFQNLLKNHIGSRPVAITSVNAGLLDVQSNLARVLPYATFYHYNEASSFIRSDNRKVSESMPSNGHEISHGQGTFSSYTINTQKGTAVDFFKL